MTMLESLAHLPCPLHDLGSHGTPASSHSDSGLAWNHCVFYGYALFCVKIIKCLLFITKPEQFISVLLLALIETPSPQRVTARGRKRES